MSIEDIPAWPDIAGMKDTNQVKKDICAYAARCSEKAVYPQGVEINKEVYDDLVMDSRYGSTFKSTPTGWVGTLYGVHLRVKDCFTMKEYLDNYVLKDMP